MLSELDKEANKINGEVISCSYCGCDVVMTPHRKLMRRKMEKRGIAMKVFCNSVCNTTYYNKEAQRKRGCDNLPASNEFVVNRGNV